MWYFAHSRSLSYPISGNGCIIKALYGFRIFALVIILAIITGLPIFDYLSIKLQNTVVNIMFIKFLLTSAKEIDGIVPKHIQIFGAVLGKNDLTKYGCKVVK